MRRILIRIIPFLSIMALLVMSCGDKKITKPKPVGLRLAPLPDAEAEVMALWLSNEIEAPMDLYERIHSDLLAIRAGNASNPELESITVSDPWQTSYLLFSLDSTSREQLKNHESPVWDSLNALYQPTLDPTYMKATFPGRLHPERLAEAYARVPQLSDAGVGMILHVTLGWWPKQITPGRMAGDTLVYIFQQGHSQTYTVWPDSIVFWCFYSTPNVTWSAGRYAVDSTGAGDAEPSWWGDFCTPVRNINHYVKEWCQGIPGVMPVKIIDVPPQSIGRDSFNLVTASISGQFLSISVTYGGGCEEHQFLLFMSPSAFAESSPVQANLYLMHEDNGDSCKELVNQTLQFDVSPIRRQYERFYGKPGDIKLNLFNFERSASQSVLYHPK